VFDATHVVVRRTTLTATGGGDRPVVVVAGCSGLAACRTLGAALVDDWTTLETQPYYPFLDEGTDGTLTNTTVYYGSLDGDTCRDGGIQLFVLSLVGAALEIEVRTQTTDYPAVNGTCPPGVARDQGAAAACRQLRVVTGTRVEEL
jgi:hypothetical protein